jgi:O-antigen ligase
MGLKKIRENSKLPIIINSGFYVLLIFTLCYSSNLSQGFREIEKGIPFLLFPIIFFYFFSKITEQKKKILLNAFVFATAIFIVYIYGFFIYKLYPLEKYNLSEQSLISKIILILKTPFNELLFHGIYNGVEPKVFFHNAYASMNILFSVFILIDKFFKKKKIINLILILGFSYVIVHYFSMANLIAFVLLTPIFFFIHLKKRKGKIIFFISISILSIVGLNFLEKNNKAQGGDVSIFLNIREAIIFFKDPLYHGQNGEFNYRKNNLRTYILFCHLESIKDKPIIGQGIGDVFDSVKECYKSVGFSKASEDKVNSHNYYVFLWAAGGVFTLLLFGVLFVFNGLKAIKEKHKLHLFFLLLVSINLLSENMFVRVHGILFFAIFNTMFCTLYDYPSIKTLNKIKRIKS